MGLPLSIALYILLPLLSSLLSSHSLALSFSLAFVLSVSLFPLSSLGHGLTLSLSTFSLIESFILPFYNKALKP